VQTPWCAGGNFHEWCTNTEEAHSLAHAVGMLFEVLRVCFGECFASCAVKCVLLMRPRTVQGLAHLHGLGIVHGDIKPSNIVLDGKGQPLITDWGLSRESLGFTVTGNVTAPGGYSPGFTAPEVLRGERTSFASDMSVVITCRFSCATNSA